MRRVLVVGMSGSGKTTAARRLAGLLAVPLHEMDALAIGPGWSTPDDLVARVGALVAGPGWVFDSWGHPSVRDAMWAAADTVVWLDYAPWVTLPRLLRRSVRRSWTREEMFGAGNVETWRSWLGTGHPFRHAVLTHRERRRYLAERTARESHLRTVRLRSPAELDRWLAGLGGTGPAPRSS